MDEKNTVSVNEFKNWLSGVLDFQPDDWVPDHGQWNKILSKINQLEEHVVPPVPEVAPVVSAPQPKAASPVNRNPRPVGPLDQQAKVPLPEAPPKEKHVVVKQTSQPQVIQGEDGGRIINTGKVHEMGIIDTSDKEYSSSFV